MSIHRIFLALPVASALLAYQQADNTERNTRDRSANTMTAEKQGNSKADVNLVARLRKAVVDDKSLSTNAHNVKIIVNGGRIWLRGPVESEAEKTRVEALVKETAGGKTATSSIEVIKGDK